MTSAARPPDAVDKPRLDPGDVHAVLEVLSPGTRRTDRVAKLAEYAEAGIAHYGVVDPEPLTLVEFTLHDGRYEQRAEHHGTAELALGATIDLDALR